MEEREERKNYLYSSLKSIYSVLIIMSFESRKFNLYVAGLALLKEWSIPH
jgi:hypothetical protein